MLGKLPAARGGTVSRLVPVRRRPAALGHAAKPPYAASRASALAGLQMWATMRVFTPSACVNGPMCPRTRDALAHRAGYQQGHRPCAADRPRANVGRSGARAGFPRCTEGTIRHLVRGIEPGASRLS